MVRFEAVLTSDPGGGGGTFITIPDHVAAKLGLRGMPKVQAVIAGAPYRGSLRPMSDGTYGLGVLKSIQAGAGGGRRRPDHCPARTRYGAANRRRSAGPRPHAGM
ncbi:MAG TPA: DUF1905 domain-containing protein [Candidatus Dormibacteraeota bacterium]